ncbi:hypothetical protein M747DRAFT_296593 [Aspergillus niger ATCC 13496]|uniref:Uncharacterized protein n=1 Tax=Aspergillus niger ATCC 13496 TaxID=1353008 RepID=A0A370BYN2_ASPNG|nr:hypothetical protein M747DRAFT_296593 [Aspergillus niger ATCC 13496]
MTSDRILDWVEKGTTETGKTLRPVSNVPVVPSKWPGRALPCLACFSSMAPVIFIGTARLPSFGSVPLVATR